jgi:hypothetical protein
MPRRKTSDSIAHVLGIAEGIRNQINALPAEIREKTKDLALAIVTRAAVRRRRRRRGRPRGRPPGRPRGRPRGRPPGRPKAQPQMPT